MTFTRYVIHGIWKNRKCGHVYSLARYVPLQEATYGCTEQPTFATLLKAGPGFQYIF